MAINIRQTPGFDRSTSGIFEKMGITEAESVKQAKDTLKMEEGQVVEGTVCENKGQKSIEIQGEEIPVSNEAVKDYEVGETLYLKVDTKEEGKIALKILSSAEVEQIKAEQVKTEQIKSGQTRVDSKKNPYHTGVAMAKSQQDIQGISRKIEAATKEIAKLLKESKVTVTVTKDVGKAVEKVVNELDTSHLNQLEAQNVEVENTDVRTLSNMLSNIEHQEQNELNKEEIMDAAVAKGKELSTFPDGKMYYMISNELELTVNNLYKAEYSYDKDYQSQSLTKAEWEQLKPKVEEYLKKEQIAPNEENMGAAKWLMDHKLPITKANVADVKAMQTLSQNGVKEEVLRDNVEHYFELKLDPKEANVFYENEGKVAEKLMEKVGQLNEKDMDAAIRQLVKEEKPLTLDNMLKEVEKQETAGKGTNEVRSHGNETAEKESGYEGKKNHNKGDFKETKDSDVRETDLYAKVTVMDDDTKEGKKSAEKVSERTVNRTKTLDVSKKTDGKESQAAEASKNVTGELQVPEATKNAMEKESPVAKETENVTKKELQVTDVSGEGKEVFDFEKVLDELDSQDINYRKIENQEKREQTAKEKKEESVSAKEDVSYEQLGKVHFKRQTRRFNVTDIAKSGEEKKKTPSETVKESEIRKEQPQRTDKGVGTEKVLSETVDPKETETVFTETVTNKVDETSKLSSENVEKKEDTYSGKEAVKAENQKAGETVSEKIEVNTEDNIGETKITSLIKDETHTKWEAEREFYAQKEKGGQEKEASIEETSKEELRVSSGAEMKKEEKTSSMDEGRGNETREFFANEGKRQEEPKESLSKEQSTLLFRTTEGDFNKESKNHFGDRRKKPSLNTEEYSEPREVVREDADVSEIKEEFSKGQNKEAASSFNGAELEAKIITAKRQLEEIRLKLTLSSAKLLAKNDIKIDTKELSEIVDQLKELEKEACKRQLIENRIEPTEENIEQFRITTKMAEELKEMPSYSIAKFVREPIPMTMEGLHEEGKKLKTDFDAANERYETMMTKPRSDMGDSISKAFRNVDDILKEMDLEVTEANQRAVRILGYNSMEITEENLEAVKAKDLSVNRLLNQLTPQTVMEFIRKGENIIKIPVEELNLKMEAMNNEAQEKEVARYSEFLYKLEKNKEITPEERTAFVGVYRLLDKVVKSKGRDIGALVKSGQEITLKNLLTAQRTIQASKIDANIDDDFGMVSEVIEKGVKITDQIEQGFSNVSKTTNQMEQGFANVSGNSVLDSFIQEGVKNSALAGVGNQNASYLNMGGQTVLETANQEVVQQEATQQVEKEQQREQDSKMQQTISYQQDLAKEILEYVNPSDLKALSKVFGDNLENMTFEQIKDRLSRTSGKNFETAFTGEPVLDEYQDEQMKEWKQLAQTEQRVMKALSDFDVSKTLSNAKAFETIFSKESPLFEQIKKEFEPKNKKEEKEKKIQKSISSLGGFFDGKEEAVQAYDDFAEELMDESGSKEPLTTKDILARKNLKLAGNLMAKMAREESFIVPVQIQNKDTTMEVTLKSKGTEKGTIQASVVAGNWGEISAELLVEDGKVSVYSKAESKDGEAALNKALGVFEGALSKHHIALQKTEQPIQGTGNASTRQLYQVAKSFVEAFRA